MTNRLSGDPYISVAAELVACDLEDQTAILNLRTEVYYGLDPMGTQIWSFLQQRRRLSELRDLLVARYEVEAEVCERSLRRFLGELHSAGLIELSAEPTVAVAVAGC